AGPPEPPSPTSDPSPPVPAVGVQAGVPAGPGAPTGPVAPVPHTIAPARGPARRRSTAKIVGIALAVGLVAAVGTFFATRHVVGPGPGPDAGDDPSTPAVTTSAEPVPTGSASGGPVPAGYQWVEDPAGFRFLLPSASPAWQRILGSDNNQIFYSPDGKVHYLQFAVTVGQSVKPLEHMREMEASVSKAQKEYKQHKIAATAVNGHEAAVWEFSYAAKEGGRRHAIETEFLDEDGTAYAIYSSSPEKGNDWNEALQRFTTVLNSFTPTR
ncbi:hypothetical protein AB0O00_14270, partial [Kitasatospora sp. NPDC093558]